MPGGLQDMLVFGIEAGGNARALSLVHATRVLVIVSIMPMLLTWGWGLTLDHAPGSPARDIPLMELAVMLACAILGWQIGKRIGLFGAAILGPLVLSAVASLTGLIHHRPPAEAILVAQFFIGLGVGVKYTGVTLGELQRIVAAALGYCVILAILSVAFAELVHFYRRGAAGRGAAGLRAGRQGEMVVLAFVSGRRSRLRGDAPLGAADRGDPRRADRGTVAALAVSLDAQAGAQGVGDMAAGGGFGSVLVARGDGGDDGGVLFDGRGPSPGAGERRTRQKRQRAAHRVERPDEIAVVRGAVELLVESAIAQSERGGILKAGAVDLDQFVKDIDLRRRSVTRRQLRGKRLGHLAHLVEFAELVVVQRSDDEPTALVAGGDAFGLEPAQRLAHRRAADVQPVGQFSLDQPGARAIQAVVDGLEQPGIGVGVVGWHGSLRSLEVASYPMLEPEKSMRIAILDDYQGVALGLADWESLDAEVTAFRDTVAGPALIERLRPFDVCA